MNEILTYLCDRYDNETFYEKLDDFQINLCAFRRSLADIITWRLMGFFDDKQEPTIYVINKPNAKWNND